MQRWVQIQSWTAGTVWTKKRKRSFSQQPQEQQIKSPQSTWFTLHLWNTWRDNEPSQKWGGGLWEQRYIYFFPFALFVSMYVYALCDFVCIALLLALVLGSVCLFFFFFSIVLSTCYHWWICFLVWLPSFLFLSFFFFFLLLFKYFIFNNYF